MFYKATLLLVAGLFWHCSAASLLAQRIHTSAEWSDKVSRARAVAEGTAFAETKGTAKIDLARGFAFGRFTVGQSISSSTTVRTNDGQRLGTTFSLTIRPVRTAHNIGIVHSQGRRPTVRVRSITDSLQNRTDAEGTGKRLITAAEAGDLKF